MTWSPDEEQRLLRKKFAEFEQKLDKLKTDINDHFDRLEKKMSKAIQKRHKLAGTAALRNTNAKLRGDIKNQKEYSKELEIALKVQTEDEKLPTICSGYH